MALKKVSDSSYCNAVPRLRTVTVCCIVVFLICYILERMTFATIVARRISHSGFD